MKGDFLSETIEAKIPCTKIQSDERKRNFIKIFKTKVKYNAFSDEQKLRRIITSGHVCTKRNANQKKSTHISFRLKRNNMRWKLSSIGEKEEHQEKQIRGK